jgi:hypothetical protein
MTVFSRTIPLGVKQEQFRESQNSITLEVDLIHDG